MRIAGGRIFSALLTAGGWLIAGVRLVLDLIGYATIPEDSQVAAGLLQSFFLWLLSVPWWAPWGFALITTGLLIWVSWPRRMATQPQLDSSASIAAVADLVKQIRLQDKQNQAPVRRYPEGLGDLILLHVEGTAILHEMGFQSDAEYALWVRRSEQWTRDVGGVLAKYFPSEDADWFSTLGVFEAPPCPNPYNDYHDHDHRYRAHWERLRRVGRFIDNHQRG